MSRNRLAVTNRLSGGRQKIVWHSPTDRLTFVKRSTDSNVHGEGAGEDNPAS
nr:hypothetical protein [uncultured Prevotella sp.]